jgi:hypothetical protein
MPKIQREIPYTLSAYSGELTDSKKVIKVRNEKEKNNSIRYFDSYPTFL